MKDVGKTKTLFMFATENVGSSCSNDFKFDMRVDEGIKIVLKYIISILTMSTLTTHTKYDMM